MKKTISLTLVLALCMVAKADFTFGEPTNLGPMVNGSTYEEKPCISADGLSLYFSSDRPSEYDDAMEDLWVCTRPTTDDPWGPAENLGPMVNTELGEYHSTITDDELELYFERFDYGTGTTWFVFDIWVTKRADKDSAWGQSVKLDLAVPDGFMAGSPSISGDGLELYFGAYHFGDEPQSQLYVAKRETRDAPWGEPTSLGPVVNSWSCQAMPALSHDGLLLLFNDWFVGPSRPDGFGKEDIWFTRRATKDSSWSEPVNLGSLINTKGIERCGSPSADGSTLYFSSDRPFGQGRYDIWQAPIIPIVDLNSDGIVDSADMCIMVDNWGTDNSQCDIGPMPWGDGVVDVQDLIVLAEYLFGDTQSVAHFKLDEVKGSIANDSARNRDGIVHGDPAWQPKGGADGGALQLDGVDDYVRTAFLLNPAGGDFSVFVWNKGGVAGQTIVSQKGGVDWLIADAADGALRTDLRNPAKEGRGAAPAGPPLISSTVVTDGDWHRVGFVRDGDNRILYVDGIEAARDTAVGLEPATGGLYLGAGNNLEPGSFFSGLIDDVRIYNRVVSP